MVIENDDHHSQDFVIEVLCKVLGCAVEHAFLLMMEAHTRGRSVIWTGTKEGAELKVEQIHTFHEMKGVKDIGALGCEIEPAP